MDNTTQTPSTEPFKITGDWAVQSKQLKEKFSSLTDEDLQFEEGKEEELLTRITTRLDKNRDTVINIISKGLGEKAAG